MAEMSAKEFLETIQKICEGKGTCDKCEIKDVCFRSNPPAQITDKLIERYISRLELIKTRK